MRISDWSSDVCSSDLPLDHLTRKAAHIGEIEAGRKCELLVPAERKHLFLLPLDIGGVARVADQALGHVWRDTAKLRRKRGERLPRHLRKAEPFEQRARDPVLPHLQSGAEQLRRSQLRIQHRPAVRMCRLSTGEGLSTFADRKSTRLNSSH